MFATKLKVASALFLSSFFVWLGLILLVAQPTDSIGRFQFSNFALLALFLGSAIAASLLSMVIGLKFLGVKMKPISLKKKFGRGHVILQTRKSPPTVQLEKLQASRAELATTTHSLEEEEINLPDRSLSISDPKGISCPKCGKVFSIALLSLDFSGDKTKIVRTCPNCYSLLSISKNDKTASKKIAGDKKPRERSRDKKKAFFLFGETDFKGCKFELGYLGSLPTTKSIPDECFGCPQLVECFQALKTIQ